MEKNSTKIIFSLITAAILASGSFFLYHNNKSKINIPEESSDSSTSQNCSKGITMDAQKILDKNNIDLARLNGISDYESGSKLSYAEFPTGYTYEVVKNKLSINEGRAHPRSRLIAFKVCFNDMIIITRDLRMSFLDDDVYQSAFDFDFSPIEIDPTPTISLDKAKEIAYRSQSALKGINPVLGYYDLNTGTGNKIKKYILAWLFDNGATVIVNAKTGEIVNSFNGMID